MPSYTRHQLKEDRFATATQGAMHWTVEHRGTIVALVSAVAIALIATFGVMSYQSWHDDKASIQFGDAMRAYSAPLRGPDAPAQPGVVSFTSAAERAKAAHLQFAKVADEYSNTKTGKLARYMSGVTAAEMGDSKMGEGELKAAVDKGDSNVSALAKMALASLYRSSKREEDAIKLYREVAAADTEAVPAASAQFELASLYEAKQQPQEAIKVYEEVRKKGTTKDAKGKETKTATAEMAAAKIAQLKGEKIPAQP